MMDDKQLLEEFRKNVGDFLPATVMQRDEIYRSYEFREGDQWEAKEVDKRRLKDKAITTINLAAPLVRAVSGTECMQDKALSFVSMDPQFDKDADIMGDAVEWAQYASGWDSEQSIAKEDAATCGLGGTVTYLDMSQKGYIAGIPLVERIFPGFLFYDNSSRGAQLNKKARWCGYADPMHSDDLSEYIEDMIKEEHVTGGDEFDTAFLTFSNQDNLMNINLLYHYFWWEYDDIYDIANTFNEEIKMAMANDPEVLEVIGKAADEINIDWQAQYWSLDPESYRTLTKAIETIILLAGIDIPPLQISKRKGKCYYRAQIARGMVLKKGRSYTQGGHALNFVTGYFDEKKGIYYGLMRPLSWVQDALNTSISDFLSYAKTAGHGGAAYIKGSADALSRIKKEKANEDAVTPLPETAEVIPKALPSTPQVLVEFIRLMMEIMPRTLGLGQEFFGVISSGDMTDSLYGKVMKQSYAVLANFTNNAASYSKRQGEIFIDIVKLMADANDGMILPVLSPGKGQEDYFRLKKQSLAREYAVRIVERPMTADERQDTFNKLSQLMPQFAQAGINAMPILVKYAPLDYEDKEELSQLSQPAPPDPMNQEMIKSQIRLGNAQAGKWEAETAETHARLPYIAPSEEAGVQKDTAQAMKSMSDAGKSELPDIDPMDMIEKKIKHKELALKSRELDMEMRDMMSSEGDEIEEEGARQPYQGQEAYI